MQISVTCSGRGITREEFETMIRPALREIPGVGYTVTWAGVKFQGTYQAGLDFVNRFQDVWYQQIHPGVGAPEIEYYFDGNYWRYFAASSLLRHKIAIEQAAIFAGSKQFPSSEEASRLRRFLRSFLASPTKAPNTISNESLARRRPNADDGFENHDEDS